MSIFPFPSGPRFPDVIGFCRTGRRIADIFLEVKCSSTGGVRELGSVEFVPLGSNMKQQQTQYYGLETS